MPTNGKPIPLGKKEADAGKRLRELRRSLKISQATMATELGCSINTLRWHEGGARIFRADRLGKAAKILSCRIEELLPDGYDLIQTVEVGKVKHGKTRPRR